MRNVVYIILVLICLYVNSCSIYRYRHKYICHIGNVEAFYDCDVDWIKRQHQKMNLEGAASFIAMFGLVELFISQTDTSYIIQCNRPQYAHIPLGLSRDTIILQDKINVYEVPRNSSPLDTLFAHINDSVFFYDYKYEPNTVSAHIPFYARFALLDSIGNIKILANVETLSSTQEYYNKNKNKQLLLNPQLFNFLSRFLYIE